MSIKDVAQQFAESHSGVAVFPVRVVDGKKAPVDGVMWKRATRDVDRWPDWHWRQANAFGVVPHGYTVVDFDPGSAPWPDEPDTLTVRTPRGRHVWLRGETRLANGVAPHVDVRSGDGGYIIGPGSHGWSIESDRPIADVPDTWRKRINGQVRPVVASSTDADFLADVERRGRNSALTSLRGVLERNGVIGEPMKAMVRAANASLPDPLKSAELEGTVLGEKVTWERGPFKPTISSVSMRERLLSPAAAEALPPPDFVIDPIWPEGGVSMLYGWPGAFKSFIALDWGWRIAAGVPLPAMLPYLPAPATVTRRRRVLYIAAEGAAGYGKRSAAAGDLPHSPDPMLLYPTAVNLLDERDLCAVSALVRDEGFEVVIYDTLHTMTPGADENSSGPMGEVVSNLRAITEATGCMSLVVHHANRSGQFTAEGRPTYGAPQLRGSSALEGDMDNLLRVYRHDSANELKIVIETHKFKDAEPVRFEVELVKSGNSLRVDAYMNLAEPQIYGEEQELLRIIHTHSSVTIEDVIEEMHPDLPARDRERTRERLRKTLDRLPGVEAIPGAPGRNGAHPRRWRVA